MSDLSAPMAKYHRCDTGSLSEAVAIDCRTMELEPRYGWRLAHEIAHRERFVFTVEQSEELSMWAAAMVVELL